GWAGLAAVPAMEGFRQVTRLRSVTVLIVAALLVAVGLFAYFLGLLITRPLARLTRAAAQVASGDLDVHLPVVGGGELKYVTEVFNDMVARLRESRRGLERDRKSTRLNSSHGSISYAVFCLKKKIKRRLRRRLDQLRPGRKRQRRLWTALLRQQR